MNPSGFVKHGELPYEALKREVMEETGVAIEPKGLLAVRCSQKDWWLVFLADYVSGTPRSDNKENSEALFMPCDEALARPDITDATKTLIGLAKKGQLLTLNEAYASLPSSEGRVMFSQKIPIIRNKGETNMTHENLKGRVAVITGAGGVLCSGFAKDLAAQGARVAVLDLRAEAAQAVADDIKAAGGQALAVSCNVLEKESLEEARKAVNAAFGPCDILINGAGGNSPLGTTSKDTFSMSDLSEKAEGVKTFFDLDAKGIEFVFNLNFLGTLLTTQCFAKEMVGRENTSILNISSMNSYKPLTRIPAYSAAKAAVSNFTQFMAVHFAEVGLRVNAIAPGFFSTIQNKALLYNEDGSLTARSEKILGHTPLGRFGKTDDLTGALLFLCDETYSGFITGVVLPVDGGFSAYSGV